MTMLLLMLGVGLCITAAPLFVEGHKILSALAVLVGILVCLAAPFYGPHYDVWYAGMSGKAKLTEAEQSRQIKIQEAKANLESAKLNAEAEVERAKGSAASTDILIKSLGTPDRYLRWRWIGMLENNERSGVQREIIYVPADGTLPMTEAGRAVATPPKD